MTGESFGLLVSRAGADSAFAIWVARLIAAQGRSYILQDEHFGHEDFMVAMQKALSSDTLVVRSCLGTARMLQMRNDTFSRDLATMACGPASRRPQSVA